MLDCLTEVRGILSTYPNYSSCTGFIYSSGVDTFYFIGVKYTNLLYKVFGFNTTTFIAVEYNSGNTFIYGINLNRIN